MPEIEDRRYTISEVGALIEVSTHVLRQWEKRVHKLRPQRNRVGRRFYERDDIEMVRTIKYLVRHKGMKLEAVNRYISQEDYKGTMPKSPDSAHELIVKVRTEVEAMLDELEHTRRTRG